MDLAIRIALGSAVQVATFLLPVIVLVDWAMGLVVCLPLGCCGVDIRGVFEWGAPESTRTPHSQILK